jgi:hypothetical protein
MATFSSPSALEDELYKTADNIYAAVDWKIPNAVRQIEHPV